MAIEPHWHVYDLSRFPEGRCTVQGCGDIGMNPPVEFVRLPDEIRIVDGKGIHIKGKLIPQQLPPERGPAFWCQVCGAHFMTEKWARHHWESANVEGTLCKTPVIVQLRQPY